MNKSGDIVPESGRYGIVDKNGVEYTGLYMEFEKGEIFPPLEYDESSYILLDQNSN